jgi:hypothetical protein
VTCDYFEMATVNVAGRLGHPRRSLQLSSHVCGDQQQVTAQRHPVGELALLPANVPLVARMRFYLSARHGLNARTGRAE